MRVRPFVNDRTATIHNPTVSSLRKPLLPLVFDTGEAATVRRYNAR